MAHRLVHALAVGCACLSLLACGGSQTQRAPVVVEEPPCAPCFGDRWEQPPPQIGQTPPPESAPTEQIDEFEAPGLEGSGTLELR